MKNLKVLHEASETAIQISNNENTLKASIGLAFERVNLPVFKIDDLSKDVLSEFKGKDINLITEAIKKGSLGLYGRTYRMSTQEVCIWIREYLKTNKVSKENFISNPHG